MIIGYVEVMSKMDKKLTEHDKFYGGGAAEIRQRLVQQKQEAGLFCSYYMIAHVPVSPCGSGGVVAGGGLLRPHAILLRCLAFRAPACKALAPAPAC